MVAIALEHGPQQANIVPFFKKWAKPGLFLVYFRSFSQHKDKYSTNFTINDKSIDGVLGSRTRGGMMEVADESTELWRHPSPVAILIKPLRM